MNDIETRLRDAYRAAAATISPETTRELGEQSVTISPAARPVSRRSRGAIMVPLAAAAAAAAVAITAVVLPHVLASQHRPGLPAAAGSAPRYVVQLDTHGPGGLRLLVIRDVVTGAKVARLAAPTPALGFNAIATGDGTHFVAALDRDGGCTSRLYQFQLSAAGQPSALTPFKLPVVRPGIVSTMALSKDNKTFAFDRETCGSWGKSRQWISVLSLRTMRTRSWEVPAYATGNTLPLSLTANGDLLAYGIGGNWSLYTLRTRAAPGPLIQRSRVVATAARFGRSSTIQGYALTPDGRALYVHTEISLSNYASGHSWQISVIDLATGRGRLIRQFRRADTNWWTPDWSARRALVPSVTMPKDPYAPAPVRFLVISLVTGRTLRSLQSGPWDPTNSLFSW